MAATICQLTVTPLENGFGCRLQIDEGVLEMLGKTAEPSGDSRDVTGAGPAAAAAVAIASLRIDWSWGS